jgi:MOSC domain
MPDQGSASAYEMPKISPPRKIRGQVAEVLSAMGAANGGEPKAFQSIPQQELTLDFEGICGNRHRGWTRPADGRVPYLARGTDMRNTRHVTLVSREELAEVARRLEIPICDPRTLGANLVIEGLKHLSFLPRGTRLLFDGGTILAVEDQNEPCTKTGEAIQRANPGRSDLRTLFPKCAIGLRGLLATVERPGTLRPNTTMVARLPKQWIYAHR